MAAAAARAIPAPVAGGSLMKPFENLDPVPAAAAVFNALVGDSNSGRYEATEFLYNTPTKVDLKTLRQLLRKAIEEDWYAGKEDEDDDHSIARTRSWLLGALAHIAAGDEAATDLVVAHVDKKTEPYHWARYWSLEGLIAADNPRTEAVATESAGQTHDPIVAMLATAFLASRGHKDAVPKIRKALDHQETQWFALRALRVVPIPATVPRVCQIVDAGEYTDVTYDAIMTLGVVPNEWGHAATAAQSLSACIQRVRESPWMDGMRTGAIQGLGNLKIESSGSLLVDELLDHNPAIVREAVRAMEKILGLKTCVMRIVEAAMRSAGTGIDNYGRALRWLDREAIAEELESLMTTGSPPQRDIARSLLSEIGGAAAFEKLRARTDVMKQYSEVLEKTEQKVRELFESSVEEARNGFRIAIVMDVVVFAVGVLLLLGSAVYTLFGSGDFEKWVGVGVAGGSGVLGMIYGVLIANPRRQVRESVDHLMRVKIVFLAYLRRLHQADQAYSRRLLDDEPISLEDVTRFSDAVGKIMQDTVLLEFHLDGAGAAHAEGAGSKAVGHGAAPASENLPA